MAGRISFLNLIMKHGTRKFSIVIVGISCVILFWIYWVSTGNIGDQSGLIQFLSVEELKYIKSLYLNKLFIHKYG